MLLQEIKDIYGDELGPIFPKEEVDSFFYLAIEHYLDLPRFVLTLQPNLNVTKEEEQPLFETLAQLKKEKPIQYILGEAHFMDLILKVDERVLIPRPETEELVEWLLSDYQVERNQDLRILDIGTGSGCIAIAIAKNLPNAEVYALDISEKALELATENAAYNEVSVTFIERDILEVSPDSELEPKLEFDIIVSNPPYVRELEKEQIKNNIKKHEPGLALYVPDTDALLFYRAITRFAEKYLNKNGKLYLEINQYLGEETRSLLEAHNFLEIELRKDMFGNDRMLKGQRN
ncbi:peptide chain release factor N(5)-glutamine methyltransferase [Flagellimonas flava]|uniref:Release factor glutamine methyltransferase n=1 Tax=Flagellimonas flava TaxID=570519 RepID=A0A1M5I8L3_9FLAO|nr:peptide chain release factor N(5)-glutamine methyltransferase [Allomuricauda flava]SHG24728.1 release factor glutamine methyltransferase [Allomuricauda flava]